MELTERSIELLSDVGKQYSIQVTAWDETGNETQVTTENMSYFSRSYRAREFERQALAELHQRGATEAKTVVAVNIAARHRRISINVLGVGTGMELSAFFVPNERKNTG